VEGQQVVAYLLPRDWWWMSYILGLQSLPLA
jgi:hypothetical protein